MSGPKRLIVEFEDGSTKEIDAGLLSRSIWPELAPFGVTPPEPSFPRPGRNYVLLRWKNGWREVVGVDKAHLEIERYYVLERVEGLGRMVFQTGEDYPWLLRVDRLPKNLEQVMIVGPDGVQTRALISPAVMTDLTFQEADKAEYLFQIDQKSSDQAMLEEIRKALRAELERMNLTPAQLESLDAETKAARYQDLARSLDLWAMQNQEDVYGFLRLVISGIS